ncbi:MAG: hypothetical protein ACXWC2_06060 [Ramlibacter sp.]
MPVVVSVLEDDDEPLVLGLAADGSVLVLPEVDEPVPEAPMLLELELGVVLEELELGEAVDELLDGEAPMVLDDGLVLDDGVVVLLVEGEAPMLPVPEPAVLPPVVGAVVLLLGLAPVLPALAPAVPPLAPPADCATA